MINYRYFIHPEDEKAMKAMKSIPGFDMLVKKIMKIGYEQMAHGINMASKIRLSERQLPEIYSVVKSVSEKFEIEVPEVYLEMNPMPNAYTFGDSRVSLVLTSGLFDYLDEEEIRSVIAHECGHIVCRHSLYTLLVEFVKDGLKGIAAELTEPLKLAILYWSRKSELSADRAAALICGTESVVKTQLRLAGGPKTLTKNVDINEWARQADAYENLRKGGAWDKILQFSATLPMSHPFSAVRVQEVIKWSGSNQYKLAQGLLKDSTDTCPVCHEKINPEWTYCEHCGTLLKKETAC